MRSLRFETFAACATFLEANRIEAIPYSLGSHFIAIYIDKTGVFGVTSETTMMHLEDW